jgi:hypothetical protein
MCLSVQVEVLCSVNGDESPVKAKGMYFTKVLARERRAGQKQYFQQY